MKNELPIVALVGAPNAGKSTLLNRIEGKRRAITSNIAGTTRDRQYAITSWAGVDFMLTDTAGIINEANSELEVNVQKQIEMAISEADVLVFVVDGKAEKAGLSQAVIQKIRKSKKPVILAINKTDSVRKIDETLDKYKNLGIKESFAVSAITGNGLGDLLDSVIQNLKNKKTEKLTKEESTGIAVSIIGKPNVGKSTLFNSIIKEDRVVVSPTAGTTRTAIDTEIKIDGVDYLFIDTAGLKRKAYRQDQPDVYAGYQTFKSIRRSDVCLFLMESTEKITKQDQILVSEILEMEKGLIFVVNKMDEYKGSEEALQAYISEHFRGAWMCPVYFISAKNNEGIDEMLRAIPPIYEARNKTVDQESINKLLAEKMKKSPPRRLLDQKIPRVYGLKQIGTNPPTFELFVNHPAAISDIFRRTIKNGITKDLGFWGTPVSLKLKSKDKK